MLYNVAMSGMEPCRFCAFCLFILFGFAHSQPAEAMQQRQAPSSNGEDRAKKQRAKEPSDRQAQGGRGTQALTRLLLDCSGMEKGTRVVLVGPARPVQLLVQGSLPAPLPPAPFLPCPTSICSACCMPGRKLLAPLEQNTDPGRFKD